LGPSRTHSQLQFDPKNVHFGCILTLIASFHRKWTPASK
jgi:hypothetical protein